MVDGTHLAKAVKTEPASAGFSVGDRMTIDEIKRDVAKSLKDYCKRAGFTQSEFAFLTGTTQPRASRVFNLNLDTISLDSLFKMVENLDLNVTLTIGE
jgi:predicted XRE-type DNA-binding protein